MPSPTPTLNFSISCGVAKSASTRAVTSFPARNSSGFSMGITAISILSSVCANHVLFATRCIVFCHTPIWVCPRLVVCRIHSKGQRLRIRPRASCPLRVHEVARSDDHPMSAFPVILQGNLNNEARAGFTVTLVVSRIIEKNDTPLGYFGVDWQIGRAGDLGERPNEQGDAENNPQHSRLNLQNK